MDDKTMDALTGEIEDIQPNMALSVISSEIDMQIATAKRFPRRKDREIAIKIMDRAVLNPEIAGECIYSLPRDNKTIIGPSIRFAEIVRSCMGNIRVASRFVRIDADDRNRQAVIIEAVAYDTEMNDFVSTQVRRSIMTSAKNNQIPRPFSVDMIATTIQAAMSIGERNATLKLVPKALWIEAHQKVVEVVKGKADTLAERRKKMIEAFKLAGVEAPALFQSLGVESEDDISLNDMPRLTGMWTALRDGETAESVLGMAMAERGKSQHAKVEDPLGDAPAGSASTQQAGISAGTTPGARQEPAGESPQQRGARTKAERKAAQEAAEAAAKADTEATRQEARSVKASTSHQPDDPDDDPRQVEAARDMRAQEEQEGREASRADVAALAKQQVAVDPPVSAFDELHDYIRKSSGSAGALLDWWKSKRAERASLNLEQQGEIGKFYTAKFNKLIAEE